MLCHPLHKRAWTQEPHHHGSSLALVQPDDDGERVPRTLTGPVVTELLGLACLAPLLDSPLRAPVDRSLKASDASPSGAAVVEAALPRVPRVWPGLPESQVPKVSAHSMGAGQVSEAPRKNLGGGDTLE